MNGLLIVLTELIAILIIAALIDYLFVRSFAFFVYRILVAPGIIVHELSHAFFCLITGAKITSVSLFKKEGGSVTHTNSKIPLVGNILISLAPLAVGVMFVYLLSNYLGLNHIGSWENLKNFTTLNWLIFYLIFSIAVTMTPSRQDIFNIAVSLAVLIIIFTLLYLYADLSTIINTVNLNNIKNVLNTVLITEIIIGVVAFIIYLISYVLTKKIKGATS